MPNRRKQTHEPNPEPPRQPTLTDLTKLFREEFAQMSKKIDNAAADAAAARELAARSFARGTADVTSEAGAAGASDDEDDFDAPIAPPARPRKQYGRSKPTNAKTFVGDNASAEDLIYAVIQLTQARPLYQRELIELTGARRDRVGGAITTIQRRGEPLFNIGMSNRALWWYADDENLTWLREARRRDPR